MFARCGAARLKKFTRTAPSFLGISWHNWSLVAFRFRRSVNSYGSYVDIATQAAAALIGQPDRADWKNCRLDQGGNDGATEASVVEQLKGTIKASPPFG